MYRFLCDLQYLDSSEGIGFHWFGIEYLYKHLPRITYKDVIIAKEQWVLAVDELKENRFHLLGHDILVEAISKWRKKESIPRYVQLKTGDNLLLVDFSSALSVGLFLNETTKLKHLKIVEYLAEEGQPVTDAEQNGYTSEFMFVFSRKEVTNGD